MIDLSTIDMKATVVGQLYDTSTYVCRTSNNRPFHGDTEIAVSKAAKADNHLQMISTVANTSIDDAIDGLAEVDAGVNGKMPVLFDSGIRRGTDILKAINRGNGCVIGAQLTAGW